MISFDHAWAFLLLPLPWLVWSFVPPFKEQDQSIKVPFFNKLIALSGRRPSDVSVVKTRQRRQWFLILFCWAFIVTALSGPVFLGSVQTLEKSGRDLMIAVDISGSMEARDFVTGGSEPALRRWDGLVQILSQFAESRKGDRLGLIAFGSGAYLQYPFSLDHATWQMILNSLDVNMAGPATAIGDAIGLGIKSFDATGSRHRMMILVTDGTDTVSRLPPVEAAKVAETKGVVIYTIAMGDPKQVTGESAVDVKVLEKISGLTGGTASIAGDQAQFNAVLREIDRVEPARFQQAQFQPRRPLARYFLVPVVLMTLLVWLSLMGRGIRRKRGAHV